MGVKTAHNVRGDELHQKATKNARRVEKRGKINFTHIWPTRGQVRENLRYCPVGRVYILLKHARGESKSSLNLFIAQKESIDQRGC